MGMVKMKKGREVIEVAHTNLASMQEDGWSVADKDAKLTNPPKGAAQEPDGDGDGDSSSDGGDTDAPARDEPAEGGGAETVRDPMLQHA